MQGPPLPQLPDTGGHVQEEMAQLSQIKSTGSIWWKPGSLSAHRRNNLLCCCITTPASVISSGKSDRVSGEELGHATGFDCLQTQQVIAEIAFLVFCCLFFFPWQLLEKSTTVLWQGREYINFCHQKYAAIKGKSLCVTAIKEWQRQVRVESRKGVCNSTDAHTGIFLHLRSYWRVTNPRCSSSREQFTWLLLSNGPDTGREKKHNQLMRRGMLQQTHQGLNKDWPPELFHSQEPENIN